MTLKDVIGEELNTQVEAAIAAHNAKEADKAKQVRFVDLSEGLYVSKNKFDDRTAALNQQITDLQGQIAKRDTDMADLNTKLTAAQADAAKLSEAQTALTQMQSRYNADKQEWADKAAKQAYEFAVRTEAGKLKFSSSAAQREFIRGAIDAGFKMDGETLLGFTDYVQKYRTEDPSAFAPEDSGKADPPAIVLPAGKTPPPKSTFGFHFTGVRPAPKE